MTKKYSNSSLKQRFIEINGQQVPVTEEVYHAYKQPTWAEHKRQEREKRCMVSTGRGGTKRCESDCGKCDRQRTGSVLSLDRLTEDGFDYADPSSVSGLVEDKLELELLAAALDKLAPEEKSLIRALFYDERTVRDCAAEIGISHQAVVKRKQKILEKLRGIMEK